MYNQADWTDLQNDANHRRKPAIQKESKAIETKENNKEKEDAMKRILVLQLAAAMVLYGKENHHH